MRLADTHADAIDRGKMARKFRKREQQPRLDSWQGGGYKDQPRDNALLEAYYNHIIPGDQQEAFWATLRTPLPSTFRLVTAEPIPFADLISPLGFVPNAYKLPANRRELKKEEGYAQIHSWLLRCAEAGAVVRQEAVSMLPPLFLNIDRPDLAILDMCAAPGSKTGQLLEYLHRSAGAGPVTGMVIANDADQDRAYMLHHQVSRLHSPALLVTCNDASLYPRITGADGSRLQFDRVMCDVPCSGDGTLRKTPSIWASWTPQQAFGLHSLQARILSRGLSLLKPGGRLVYSTCSLNPVEDEAVVAHVLGKFTECRLVEVADSVADCRLVRTPGLSRWSVMASDGQFHDAPVDGQRLKASFFPPANAAELNLHYSFRILPHHQDTGGFYIAVIEKGFGEPSDPKPDDAEPRAPADAAAEGASVVFCPVSADAMGPMLSKYLLTTATIDSGLFVTRSLDRASATPKNVLYCTPPVHHVATHPHPALSIINCGVRAFERYEPSARHAADSPASPYRILAEFVSFLFTTDRPHGRCPAVVKTVEVDRAVFEQLLSTDTTIRWSGDLNGMLFGGSVVRCGTLWMCVWMTGDMWVRPFVSKQDRPLLMERFKRLL